MGKRKTKARVTEDAKIVVPPWTGFDKRGLTQGAHENSSALCAVEEDPDRIRDLCDSPAPPSLLYQTVAFAHLYTCIILQVGDIGYNTDN
jgi:hypothetical protein